MVLGDDAGNGAQPAGKALAFEAHLGQLVSKSLSEAFSASPPACGWFSMKVRKSSFSFACIRVEA